MALMPLGLAWFVACTLLLVIFIVRQSRYSELLAQEYPDSDFGRIRLGESGRVAMPWDRVGAMRRLQRERGHDMPPEVQRARQAGMVSWIAFDIAVFGGAVLIVAGAMWARDRQISDTGPAGPLIVLTAAAIVLTAMVFAMAVATPRPFRWLYLAGGLFALAGTGLLSRMLVV
jgi:hypothetical protein